MDGVGGEGAAVTVVLEPLQEKPLLLLPSHLKNGWLLPCLCVPLLSPGCFYVVSSPRPSFLPHRCEKSTQYCNTSILFSLSVSSLISLETLKTLLLSEEDEGEGLCPRARVIPNANPGLQVYMGHHNHLFGCKTKQAIKHDGNCKRTMSCNVATTWSLSLPRLRFLAEPRSNAEKGRGRVTVR
jgi:hypothetical protein